MISATAALGVMSRPGSDSINPAHAGLLHAEPLLELHHIDDAAAMGAVTDLAVAVPGLDLEHHALAVDLDHARNGADGAADRRCGEVTDFHVHADADEALRQMRSDGGA